MTQRYAHVVFDLDGTLVDTRADLTAAVNHVLHAFALPPLPLSIVCEYVGEGARVLVQRALGGEHADRLDDGLRLFLVCYGDHLLDQTKTYPGIEEVLRALVNRGVLLSVLTNKPEAMSRAILAGLQLLPYFRAVVGGDSLATRKPDPAGIAHLLALTDTLRDQTMLVGDSPIDLNTAAASGVAFCGVSWGLATARLRAAAPARMIDAPEELLAIVEGESD